MLSFHIERMNFINYSQGSLDIHRVHNLINDNNTLKNKFKGIRSNGTQIQIAFSSSLNTEEQDSLDQIINDYFDYNQAQFLSYYLSYHKVSNSNYVQVATFYYQGSYIVPPITRFELVAYKDPSVTSYDARVINLSNGQVLAEKTGLTNIFLEHFSLGNISNVPPNSSLLELQIRSNATGSNKNVTAIQLLCYLGS